MNEKQTKLIQKYRNEVFPGLSTNLVPISSEYLKNIVYLRNQDHSKYYLNQPQNITLESQNKWYEQYLKRDNDIYWCIEDKENNIVGTVRLYDITENNCEHGSFIIGKEYTMGSPFALEAMILSLDFAFKTLNLDTVECNDRADNSNMNSITKRFGFLFDEKRIINGVEYNHYVLKKENCKTAKYLPLLQKYIEGDSV